MKANHLGKTESIERSSILQSTRVLSTYFAKGAQENVCPPYCEPEIIKLICAARFAAVEKRRGRVIFVSFIIKPLSSISSILNTSQLCNGITGE